MSIRISQREMALILAIILVVGPFTLYAGILIGKTNAESTDAERDALQQELEDQTSLYERIIVDLEELVSSSRLVVEAMNNDLDEMDWLVGSLGAQVVEYEQWNNKLELAVLDLTNSSNDGFEVLLLFNERDNRLRMRTSSNEVEWVYNQHRYESELERYYGEGYFTDFSHSFEFRITKMDMTVINEPIIRLWDVRNEEIDSSFMITAQNVDVSDSAFTISVEQETFGAKTYEYTSDTTLHVNQTYIVHVTRNGSIGRVKVYDRENLDEALIDTGEFSCSSTDYSSLVLVSNDNIRRNWDRYDWSSGFLWNLRFH